jgi:hypothetical protein
MAAKSTVEQTVEIEEVVADALDQLDHARYALKMLENRLMAHPELRSDGAQT